MDKQRLIEAVDRYVKRQGNQMGIEGVAEILSELIESVSKANGVDNFEEFNPTTSYVIGDIVRKDGKLYKFIAVHQGTWDIRDVEETTIVDILGGEVVRTSISAFQSNQLEPQTAALAGFTPEVIRSLWEKAHPTIRFSDQMVTFNSMEETSHELSIHTAVVYDAPHKKLYHLTLYLYANGRILYNVGEIKTQAV